MDIGHIAWIWVIRQNLSKNGLQRRQKPAGGAGGDGGQIDGRTDFPCVLHALVLFGATAKIGKAHLENQKIKISLTSTLN